MNTYIKYCPNVYLAKCEHIYNKGEVITVTTQHGKEHECIVFNLIGEKNGYYFYSVVRADGYNAREHAKRKAERLQRAADNAGRKSDQYWQASNEGKDFLVLGEPIKIGHHSERRHRALIERNYNRMSKSVEMQKRAQEYEHRKQYWDDRTTVINLSMPESVEYFEHKLDQAKAKHEGLKSGTIPRAHSFSLTYAKKEVNEMEKNLATAKKLWE